MARSQPLFLCLTTALYACFCIQGSLADPDPVKDFPVTSPDIEYFVLRNLFSLSKATLSNAGGSQHQANSRTFPGVITQGVSATLLRIKPCGINAPHTHPRATEHQYIFKGKLAIGLVDTHDNYFANIVNAGDTFVFPRSLLHFEINVGTEEVVSLAFFNSELAGTIPANEAYQKLPLSVLASSFGVSERTIQPLITTSNKVVAVDEACLAALRNGTLDEYAKLLIRGRVK